MAAETQTVVMDVERSNAAVCLPAATPTFASSASWCPAPLSLTAVRWQMAPCWVWATVSWHAVQMENVSLVLCEVP